MANKESREDGETRKLSFKKLTEANPPAIIEVDKKGEVVYANSRAEEVLGLEESEITDRTYDDPAWKITDFEGNYFPTEQLPFEIVKNTGKLVEGVRHAIEWPNGKRKPLSINATPLFDEDGNFDGIVSIAEDITKECQLDQDLKDSERFLENVFDSIQDGISVLSPDLTIRHVNETMNRRYEKNTPLEGEKCHEVYRNREHPCVLCPTRRCMKSGELERDIVPGLPGSETKWIELFSYPMIDSRTGEVTGVFEFVRDITKRREAERRQEHLNSILRSIRGVNQLLVRANDKDSLIEGICDTLVNTRDYHHVWVALFDDSDKLITSAEAGLGEDFEPLLEMLKEGDLPRQIRNSLNQNGIILTKDPSTYCKDCPLTERHEGASSITVKLEQADEVYGILSAAAPEEFISKEEEQEPFEEMAGDIAFGLCNIEVDKERREARKALEAEKEKLRQSFVELAETTSRVLGVRDPYTQRHEQRVAELAREVGKRMELDEDKLLGLYLGGTLHDIGKIAIPETILTKPGELKGVEWRMIRSHPEVGYNQILEDTDFPWPVAEMTLHYH